MTLVAKTLTSPHCWFLCICFPVRSPYMRDRWRPGDKAKPVTRNQSRTLWLLFHFG